MQFISESLQMRQNNPESLRMNYDIFYERRNYHDPLHRRPPGWIHCAPHRPCAQRPCPRTANQLSPPAQRPWADPKGGDAVMICSRKKMVQRQVLYTLLDAQKNMASTEKVDARGLVYLSRFLLRLLEKLDDELVQLSTEEKQSL